MNLPGRVTLPTEKEQTSKFRVRPLLYRPEHLERELKSCNKSSTTNINMESSSSSKLTHCTPSHQVNGPLHDTLEEFEHPFCTDDDEVCATYNFQRCG